MIYTWDLSSSEEEDMTNKRGKTQQPKKRGGKKKEFLGFKSDDQINQNNIKKIKIQEGELAEINNVPKTNDVPMMDTEKNVTKDNFVENLYEPKDRGPFIVIAEKESINEIKLGETLVKSNIRNIVSIKKINKNKAAISFTEYRAANHVIKINKKMDEYKMYIPQMYTKSIGIVRDVPIEHSITELMENTVCPDSKIDDIARLTRWNAESQTAEPTTTIKIIFRSTFLPEKVVIFYALKKVTFYIPKPLWCNRCLRYGHTRSQCRGKEICRGCLSETICKPNCTNSPICKYCGPGHKTNDRNCKEKMAQMEIKKIMVKEKKNYFDAKNKYKENNNEPLRQNQYNEQPINQWTQNNLAKQLKIEEELNDLKKMNQLFRDALNNVTSAISQINTKEEADLAIIKITESINLLDKQLQ